MRQRQFRDGAEVPALGRGLRAVRRRAKAMLVAQRFGLILACLVATVLGTAMGDFVLRTPSWFRGALLVIGLVFLGVWLWQYVVPALRFSPSLTEVALRIEKTEAGRRAGLQHVLASGLELSDAEHGQVRGAGPVVEEAGRRFGRMPVGAVISKGPTGRSLAALALAALVGAGVFIGSPDFASIGARRVLLPWSGAQWPKRTEVADATGVAVHPMGTALPLRAALLRGRAGAEKTRVVGRYRLIQNGVAGPVRRVLLASQDKPVEVVTKDGEEGQARSGVLFERLIEPISPTVANPGGTPGLRVAEVEYWFETEDDATQPARVLLVEPPTVLNAEARVTAPAYAPDSGAGVEKKKIELGAGSDERASPAPMLAGSRVRLTIQLNKAVPTPGGTPSPAWLGAALGDDIRKAAEDVGGGGGFAARLEGTSWSVEWTLKERTRIAVHLTDEHGIKGVEESAYTFEALEDRAPSATVTRPQEDKTVLPSATVEVSGEGLDDVGLSWLTLERRRARAPKGSQGAPAEAVGEWTEMARVSGAAASDTAGAGASRRLEVHAPVNLAELGVQPGDEVWLSAAAADAYELDGKRHEPSRSPVRRLRIISVEELTEQVWAELSGIRRSAISLEEEQGKLQRDAQRGGESTRLERSQAGITDRVARDRQSLDHLSDRIKENGLKDDTLAGVMREAGRLMDQAGKKSVEAGKDLKDGAKAEQEPGADPNKAGKKERQEAGKAQDEVRENLANLAELLDQGEDTWAMRRSLERVLSEQRSLREQTADAGKRTLGKSAEQLTAGEKQELAKIAAEQKGVAQKAAEAIQKMLEAQPKLQKKDPAGADALAEAARRGQQDQVPQKMEQAGKQVEQNQTSSAEGSQDRAIESLEQMLQSLKNASRNRDEVLRRKLASLIDSLEVLIKEQEKQLGLLPPAREKGEFAGLDAGMARLHQNTLGVLDEASQGPRELQPVARAIGEAASAQSASVVALRVPPINADEAEAQETISLEKLKEAKEAAERLDREAQGRQTARKRAELKRAYTEALEEQVALRTETEPLVGAESTRRTKATARTLGDRQAGLQDKMAKLESETKELSEAVMFSYAHKRLDAAMAVAAEGLKKGEPDTSVVWNEDRAVRVLQAIVKALEDSPQDKEFRDQQQSGGQGQQGKGQPPPLVPPVAELKLLKSMQEEAMDLTRETDADGAAGHADAERISAVGKLQKDLAEHGDTLIKKLMDRSIKKTVPPEEEPGKDGGESRPSGGGGGQ